MGLSTLFGRNLGPMIGGIQVDVSIRETHSTSREISENPIEVGSDIADHVKKKPDEVSLEGVLSNLPSSLLGAIFSAASADERSGQAHGRSNNEREDSDRYQPKDQVVEPFGEDDIGDHC